MKALVAFIVMAVVILVLIEINERIKAKKKSGIADQDTESPRSGEAECTEACSDCQLLAVCDKETKKRSESACDTNCRIQ